MSNVLDVEASIEICFRAWLLRAVGKELASLLTRPDVMIYGSAIWKSVVGVDPRSGDVDAITMNSYLFRQFVESYPRGTYTARYSDRGYDRFSLSTDQGTKVDMIFIARSKVDECKSMIPYSSTYAIGHWGFVNGKLRFNPEANPNGVMDLMDDVRLKQLRPAQPVSSFFNSPEGVNHYTIKMIERGWRIVD
jgi:hypothetical protein